MKRKKMILTAVLFVMMLCINSITAKATEQNTDCRVVSAYCMVDENGSGYEYSYLSLSNTDSGDVAYKAGKDILKDDGNVQSVSECTDIVQRYVFLIDCSDSMKEHVDQIKSFVKELDKASQGSDCVYTVRVFGDSTKLTNEGLQDINTILTQIDNIEFATQTSTMSDSLIETIQYLETSCQRTYGDLQSIILFTDIDVEDTAESIMKAEQYVSHCPEIILHTVAFPEYNVCDVKLKSESGLNLKCTDDVSAQTNAVSIHAFTDNLYRVTFPYTNTAKAAQRISGSYYLFEEGLANKTYVEYDNVPVMVKNSITGWSVPPVDVSPDHGEDTDKPEDPSGGVGDIIEGIKDKLPDAGEPGKEDVPDETEPETEETADKTIEETIEETTEDKDGIKVKAGLLIPVIIIAAVVALVIIAVVVVIVLKNKKSNHSRINAGIKSEVKRPVNSAGINSDTGRFMNNAGQSGYLGQPELRLMIEVLSGPDTGRKEILTLGDGLVIGCDSTCDLVLDDEKIAGFNTKIFYNNGQIFIEDMNSPFGTILGGMRIYHANRLRSGDVILIGDTYFIVQFEGV